MSYSHVIGFDDAPFDHSSHEPVLVVGSVCAGTRLHGVVSLTVSRDGSDSAGGVIETVRGSRFREHLQLVMLQGIAFAGFNVVDVFAVHDALHLPVLVISRRKPDLEAIRHALLKSVPNGEPKWEIIDRLGEMEPVRGVWVQRVGLELEDAAEVLESTVVEGKLPEALRIAHLVAGGIIRGESGGRP